MLQPIDFQKAPVLNPAQLGGIETAVLDNGPGAEDALPGLTPAADCATR